MPPEIVTLLVGLGIAAAVYAIAFILVPWLQTKYPQVWATITSIFARKDLMEFIWQVGLRFLVPEVERPKADQIFTRVMVYVQIAEDMMNEGELAPEQRKAWVIEKTKLLIADLGLAWTPRMETAVGLAIEFVVNILQLHRSPASAHLNA